VLGKVKQAGTEDLRRERTRTSYYLGSICCFVQAAKVKLGAEGGSKKVADDSPYSLGDCGGCPGGAGGVGGGGSYGFRMYLEQVRTMCVVSRVGVTAYIRRGSRVQNCLFRAGDQARGERL